MHYQWWKKKAEEVQHAADTNNVKQLFSSIKSIYGPSSNGTAPLLSADGTVLIKDKPGISNRWKEHFSQLLNRHSSVAQLALDQIAQQPTRNELENTPTIAETEKAIKQMNCGKASLMDGNPAELYKVLDKDSLYAFHQILTSIWEEKDASGLP
jgi:hypothetical protein